jgi:hypothetical protein
MRIFYRLQRLPWIRRIKQHNLPLLIAYRHIITSLWVHSYCCYSIPLELLALLSEYSIWLLVISVKHFKLALGITNEIEILADCYARGS